MNIPREEILETREMVMDIRSRQFVPHREVFPEITEEDFHISTKVDFKPVELTHETALETWEHLKKTLKKVITSYHESHGRSKSKYITTKDGFVYRMSDHWGCVKTCIWTRNGEGNLIPYLMLSGPMEIGKSHLSDFQPHHSPTQTKKYHVLNPEWVDKIRPIRELTNTLKELRDHPDFKELSNEDKFLIGSNYGLFSKQLQNIPN